MRDETQPQTSHPRILHPRSGVTLSQVSGFSAHRSSATESPSAPRPQPLLQTKSLLTSPHLFSLFRKTQGATRRPQTCHRCQCNPGLLSQAHAPICPALSVTELRVGDDLTWRAVLASRGRVSKNCPPPPSEPCSSWPTYRDNSVKLDSLFAKSIKICRLSDPLWTTTRMFRYTPQQYLVGDD